MPLIDPAEELDAVDSGCCGCPQLQATKNRKNEMFQVQMQGAD